jgi:periplasmic protein TonB
MAHALLLSPDDQAVSAITGVLDEMSVSCERPLDAVSAAKKLNSHSFELVLVDCENLPAAKLIFDVCRRATAGTNAVPIAIVDGRAGLPTAFRLGAELILTKPVAKDQARNTIRTAVNRLRKEEPTRPAQPIEAAPAEVAPPPENRAQAAVAAAVSSEPPKTLEVAPPVPPAALAVAKMNAAAEKIVVAPTPAKAAAEPTPSSELSAAPIVSVHPCPALPAKFSDDPMFAELKKEDTEPRVPMFAYSEPPKKKARGPLVALLVLVLACGGLYAAWMYQPAFRTVVEPQIGRALALVGMSPQDPSADSPRPVPTPSSARTPALPTAARVSLPGSAPSLDSAKLTTSDRTPTTPAGSRVPVERVTGTTSAAAVAVAGGTEPASTTDARKNFAPAAPVGAELPGEKNAVMLSSRGAENRLIVHAQPAYPEEARSERAEGTVVLKTVVSESGKVEGVRLVEGNPILATAAIGAVKQWRYRPYVRDGKALPFQTIVLVEFQRP